MLTTTLFDSDYRGLRSQRRKRSKSGGAGHKAGGRSPRQSNPRIEQPLPSQEGAEPCPLCGFRVEPKRLHFHMVRVHGAALRQKGG